MTTVRNVTPIEVAHVRPYRHIRAEKEETGKPARDQGSRARRLARRQLGTDSPPRPARRVADQVLRAHSHPQVAVSAGMHDVSSCGERHPGRRAVRRRELPIASACIAASAGLHDGCVDAEAPVAVDGPVNGAGDVATTHHASCRPSAQRSRRHRPRKPERLRSFRVDTCSLRRGRWSRGSRPNTASRPLSPVDADTMSSAVTWPWASLPQPTPQTPARPATSIISLPV